MSDKWCNINNCKNQYFRDNYCLNHFRKFKKYGDPAAPRATKIRKRGTGTVDIDGFVFTVRKNSDNINNITYYHKELIETFLDRKLLENEFVLHVDGNKLNNVLENLRLCERSLSYDICTVKECTNPHYTRAHCFYHYRKLRKLCDPNHKAKINFNKCVKEKHRPAKIKKQIKAKIVQPVRVPKARKQPKPQISKLGYVSIPLKDINNKTYYVSEHRYVISQQLGRLLLKGEEVHHKNCNKSDNRIENLELWTHSQPPGGRVCDLLKYAYEILGKYNKDHEILGTL